MTDSNYLEMTRLLDSLTKGADTLRVICQTKEVEDKDKAICTVGVKTTGCPFNCEDCITPAKAIRTTRTVATDKAKAHPDFKRKYFLLPDNEINSLVGIINGCNDWTSDKFKATVLFQKMRSFISATSDMPKGVSGMYKMARSKCLELMDLIPGVYPDIYPPKVRELMSSSAYQQAVEDGDITPPFTWNGTHIGLATFINNTVDLRGPKLDQVSGKNPRRDWTSFDGVFRIDGIPVTSKQLREAWKH